MSNNNEMEMSAELPGKPKIIARDHHTVSRKNIDVDALKVIRRLHSFGYQAFLVGGGVRDLLLDKSPKDFDVSTNASPEEVKELFRNSRIIGRRFKLVHVYFKGGKIIEVSTFRANNESDDPETLAHDNTFGDAESDALRRDLTINGLFYNPEDFTVIDYVGGMDDLSTKTVRIIGKPDLRFKEDPVRIIRAVRHAARIGFTIDSATLKSLRKNAELLSLVPSARMYEEIIKDFYSGSLKNTFLELFNNELTTYLFPKLDEYLRVVGKKVYSSFIERLEKLDAFVLSGKDPMTELFFACFIVGHFVEEELLEEEQEDTGTHKAQIKYLFYSTPQLQKIMQEGVPLDVHFKLPPVSIKRSQKERISSIARDIGKWFLPICLTKREKAALERLLVLRYRLITMNDETIDDMYDVIDSIHDEERLHLRWLMEVVGDEISSDHRKMLGGRSRSVGRMRKQKYTPAAPADRPSRNYKDRTAKKPSRSPTRKQHQEE